MADSDATNTSPASISHDVGEITAAQETEGRDASILV